MSYEQVAVLVVLVGAFVMFVTEVVPLGVTGLCIIAGIGLLHAISPAAGLLTSEEALNSFSSPALVLVAALYIVSAALIRTGVVAAFEDRIVRFGRDSETRLLIGATIATAVVSAFLNNTSVVVLMVPILLGAAGNLGVPPSRLLMPVSFAAILGGTLTLIGTSTNVLVRDLASPTVRIGFFDFLPFGAGFAAVGLAYMWFAGRFLLPARATVSSITRGRAMEYVTELRVPEGSPAVGLTPLQLNQRLRNRTRLLQHIRAEEVREGSAAVLGLEAEDVLVLRASPEAIVALRQDFALEPLPGAGAGEAAPRGATFAEIVITPASQLVGRTLANVGLHRTFGVAAVALQRRGSHLRRGIVDLPLRVGDVILVQGDPLNVDRLRGQPGFLLLVGVDERVAIRHRAPVAVGIIGLFVVLAAFDAAALPLLAVAAAAACLVTGCISLGRAIREIDWNVLGLLAGAITLGFALHKCKLDRSIAHGVVAVTRDLGPTAVLSAVYLITSIATELISNSGAAALMVPIALATAHELGVSARPFAFAVAFGASASFATPVGYQTNAFILGPGGYRFADFVKIGLPLQVLLWIYASFTLPLFFPF